MFIGSICSFSLPPVPHTHTTADTHGDQLGQDPEATKQLAAIEKEVEAIEVKSELEMQKVSNHQTIIDSYCDLMTMGL